MQQQAVLHESGPLLILAGAGSGKTRAITHRIAHLIGNRDVPPWRILAVTFTNKAAGELRERVERLIGDSDPPWVSTFHSACVRILRRDIEPLGYTRDFVIYDDQDQERLLKECMRDLDVPESMTARQISGRIDSAKNRGLTPERYAQNVPGGDLVGEIYGRYESKMRRANALDFGDLLVCTLRLFEEHPHVLDKYRERLWHVLVDEYQDTNRVQYRLTNLLAAGKRNLCVVGDEDQSIYRWRGAEISNILDFERDYTDATVIRLEQNYRSSGTILDAAGAVVAQNTQRKGKTLWTENGRGDKVTLAVLEDEADEARWVAGEILRLQRQGRPLRECAIFYRANAQSRAIEEILAQNRIPYALVGGIKFFGRAEVKDILAYLRLLVNPADTVAAKRIINVPARGIGGTTIERIEELEDEVGGFLAACRASIQRKTLKSAAAEKVQAFLKLIDGFAEMLRSGIGFAELAARIVEQTGYGPTLREDNSSEAQERLQNVDELLAGMEHSVAGGKTLHEYLEEVALVTDIDRLDRSADRLTLMTLHAAKGLEFPIVFMVAMEDGLFPHSNKQDDDLEEERRLCYVGMTRAMTKLYMTRANRRRVFGEYKNNSGSRFLEEIPVELVHEVGNQSRKWEQARRQTQRFEAPPAPRAKIPSSEVYVEYDDGLRVGRKVQHASFGIGTVQLLEGAGDQQKATVMFPTFGRKKLLVKFAGLQPA